MEEITTTTHEPEISIWIDKYDDVFSEFDSRPFNERALSDDFVRAVKKMVSEQPSNKIKLKFNVLEDQRNEESETIILNNLNNHFVHLVDILKAEQRAILHRGYKMLGFGSLLILGLFYLTTIPTEIKYLEGMILMAEPMGWFMTWTGLDLVFQISKNSKEQMDFSEKMSKASIAFSSPDAAKSVIPLDNNNLRVA
jgi:hypothetical protein